MRRIVHVISDLHLGGAAASGATPSFQMCPPATHILLARFMDRLPTSTDECASHLIIAGDIVDFLAEEPFSTFTADPRIACEKLQHIFDRTEIFWDALKRFTHERAGLLTLMLGNHDIELSLPGVRQMLLERVGGAGTDFIYDNQAFTLGPLLVEHGNRFDKWNAVPHDALRRVRSQLSRNVAVAPAFPALPGSRMVIDIINHLKVDYPFVDLLKPETAVALPIAAALGAIDLQDHWKAYDRFRATCAVDYDETSGEPVNHDLINGDIDDDQILWDAAQDIESGGDIGQVSGLGNPLQAIGAKVSSALRAARINALYTAFRKLAQVRRLHRDAFSMECELGTYLKPAARSAAAGFKVIVYGHTHLPKRITLSTGEPHGAVYLNTGTWADVMCVPEGIWDPDESRGRELFRRFCDELDGTSHTHWRRSVPTYARIELDGDAVTEASLRFGDNDEEASTASVWQRMQAEHAA